MERTEIMETLKYHLAQLENAENDAKNANMSVEEVTEIIRKAIIEDLTK